MNSKLKQQQKGEFFNVPIDSTSDGFNFERWAIEVRHQMLEILQRKGLKGKQKITKRK